MSAGFSAELLWSDALLFLLLAVLAAFAWRCARSEHLRAPWRRVARSRVGTSTAVVLVAYALIGIVDSVHYRPALPAVAGQPVQYAAEVRSLLDVLTGDLRTRVEDSYSAPFALHLFSRETVTQPDGSQARIFPRLKHAGTDLTDAAAAQADILQRGVRGVALGALGGAVVLLVMTVVLGRRRGGFAAGWATLWRAPEHAGTRAGLATLIALLVLGAIAMQLVPHYHVLGTDKVGTDVFYLSLKSVRTGLLIGTLTTLVTLPLALLLGIAAGYYGGRVDDVIQYIYTTLNSIPGVLLIASAVLVAQVQIELHPELFDTAAARSDLRLVCLCFILGMTNWTGLARLLRAETLKLREMDYIQAARAFGVSRARIIGRHIVPNVSHLLLITVVLDFSGLVLAEAVLSYVGVGVDPVTASWGNMINSARLELAREPMVWWQLSAAFVFMFALVLPANLFADSVRDAFDPRSGGQG